MKNRHFSFERIVEIAYDINVLTEVEKIHLENCKICQNRLNSANCLDNGIKESSKVEPLMELNHIESVADKIFDRYSKVSNRKTGRKFLFAGAVAASILLCVFISVNTGKKELDKISSTQENAVETEEFQPDVSENTEKYMFPKGVFKINKGSQISGSRFVLSAKTDSLVIHENDNYFSIKKGEVEFSVESGSDFMVNLNNSALVRVLGTIFTVAVIKNQYSVQVSEGLVEIIDLEKGISRTVSKGENEIIRRFAKTEQAVLENINTVAETNAEELNDTNIQGLEIPHQKKMPALFNLNKDPELMKAETSDLENALEYSGSPVVQLHRLFYLYRKTGHWGSIIHFWRTKAHDIDSRGNPFLKEMHFAACEASINMFLYDNEVCIKYRSSYPEGPDPKGMEDHLKMARN